MSPHQAECGCCLYRFFTPAPMVLVYVATILSWVITFDCRFFKSTQASIDGRVRGPDYTYSVGPWLVQNFDVNRNVIPFIVNTGGNCVVWGQHNELSTDDLDGALRWARSSTMMAAYSALLYSCLISTLMCVTYPRIVIYLFAGAFFFQMILVSLTFLILLSDEFCQDAEDCELDVDGWVALAAALVWMCAGICMIFTPPPRHWQNGKPPVEKQAKGTTVETVDEVIDEKTGAEVIVTVTRTVDDEGKVTTKQVTEPQAFPKRFAARTGPVQVSNIKASEPPPEQAPPAASAAAASATDEEAPGAAEAAEGGDEAAAAEGGGDDYEVS